MIGFIFSSPVSFDPSTAMENGCLHGIDKSGLEMRSQTPIDQACGFCAGGCITFATSLSGKMSLKRGLSWSEKAIGMFLCASAFAILISALVVCIVV